MLNQDTYPPTLAADEQALLESSLVDYALASGAVVRSDAAAGAVHVPLTLFPSPFPRALFERAVAIQKDFHTLYMNVANDEAFIADVVAQMDGADEFTARVWAMYETVKAEGIAQPLGLGIFRSDYLLDFKGAAPAIKQVEFNTISASFGGLSTRAAGVHRHLARTGRYGDSPLFTDAAMPANPAARDLAAGLAAAHKAYGVADALVLFVVQPGERNAFDQRWLEYELADGGVAVRRATLAEATTLCALDADRTLRFRGREVAVVYYRCAYTPDDFPTETEWDGRLVLERSRAIKCPTLLTHLAGAKKIQQVLAGETLLAKYAGDAAPRLAETFADIFPLTATSAEGARARELIATCPERYVLKPQREGGGNNVYRDKIPEFLASVAPEKWSGYILMELIEPPADVANAIIRAGSTRSGNIISELGIFGWALWDTTSGAVLGSENAGWLVRTKFTDSEEGGVAAGFGSVDSVLLV
ncbi:uncharacterized protein V1510DRAFT_391712 [Dipodascopsis tothii]|uniref:uncharacterized protein n=1 Tax=Dipodascopsis tothii TaxID=44089 RepID=UPI0034CEC335